MNNDCALTIQQLKAKKHFFVTRGFNELFPNHFDSIDEEKEIVNINNLEIIDEVDGCYYEGDNGVPAFILIPRQRSLNNAHRNTFTEENALRHLMNSLTNKNRGLARKAICDKYITIGYHALRNKPGIEPTKLQGLQCQNEYNTLLNMVSRAEHVAGSVLPKEVKTAFEVTKEICSIPGLKKIGTGNATKKETSLWPSVAVSYDYVSNAHDDKDFFLSMLNIVTTEGNKNGKYTMHMPIAQYFVFPEIGLAVALRPGDQLLFNPLFYHCISTKEFTNYEQHVYVASYYLKTAIVGWNNNSIPVDEQLENQYLCT
jgi:hypothetical protein